MNASWRENCRVAGLMAGSDAVALLICLLCLWEMHADFPLQDPGGHVLTRATAAILAAALAAVSGLLLFLGRTPAAEQDAGEDAVTTNLTDGVNLAWGGVCTALGTACWVGVWLMLMQCLWPPPGESHFDLSRWLEILWWVLWGLILTAKAITSFLTA